jgi:hypothetical protein
MNMWSVKTVPKLSASSAGRGFGWLVRVMEMALKDRSSSEPRARDAFMAVILPYILHPSGAFVTPGIETPERAWEDCVA